MKSYRVTQLAHELIAPALRPGARVLDATMGHGEDTSYIAARVRDLGELWAIDCQAIALESTRQRLRREGLLDYVRLAQCTHDDAPAYFKQLQPLLWTVIVMNLGYLPGEDKSICTDAEQTIRFISWALQNLSPGGRLVVSVYPGHEKGAIESERLEVMAQSLHHREMASIVHRVADRASTCPWIWTVHRASSVASSE